SGEDRFAALRMIADFARQREKSERVVEVDRIELGCLRQAGALRFFLVAFLRTELNIRSKAAAAQRHFHAGCGINAEDFRTVGASSVGGEGTRVATVRIVRTADEAAEFSGFQI